MIVQFNINNHPPVIAKISKTEVDEKIKARAERFGTTTSASSAIASNDKIAARKARFGVV